MKLPSVLLGICLILICKTNLIAHQGSADTSLEKANKVYAEAIATARTDLLKAFDGAIKDAAAEGKLDAVKELQVEQRAFEDDGIIPNSSMLRKQVAEYKKAIQQAVVQLGKSYEQVVKDLTKQLKVDEAEAVRAEWKKLQERINQPPQRKEEPKPQALNKKPAFEYKFFEWSAGDPAVKMIHKDEGFCYLTFINGAFQAGGESAQILIGKDGYWYLKGTTRQQFLKLQAVAVTIK